MASRVWPRAVREATSRSRGLSSSVSNLTGSAAPEGSNASGAESSNATACQNDRLRHNTYELRRLATLNSQMSMLKRYQHVYDAVVAEAGRTLDAHFAQAGIFEQLKTVADA